MSLNRHFPEGIPKAIGPYSPATSVPLEKVKDENIRELAFVSGQIPINPETNQIDSNEI